MVESEEKHQPQVACVLQHLSKHKAKLLLLCQRRRSSSRPAALVRELFRAAPCETLLLRWGGGDTNAEEPLQPPKERVLIPTSGGPHASVALGLADKLCRAEERNATALFVEQSGGDEARDVGARRLHGILSKAGLAEDSPVSPHVEVAEDVRRAIAKVAGDTHTLILVGASNVGTLRRAVFGTIPDHLLDAEGCAVGVVRSARPLLERVKERFERWLDLTIPQLGREERIDLFSRLEDGSKWNFDFMILIALSTAIAALGLVANSAAVVIGAMLVAPLMTPLLGAGLAIVQGNRPLILTSSRAIVSGFLLALLVGLIVGLCVPLTELSDELKARGSPLRLDLAVALLSGLAAAHCVGRSNLSAALPGVAIAAALVPPIATTGISLSTGHMENARGAALLFGTNVVAIILGGALSFYAGGVRSQGKTGSGGLWVRHVLVLLIIISATLAVPLGSVIVSEIGERVGASDGGTDHAATMDLIENRLERSLSDTLPRIRLEGVSFETFEDENVCEVRVSSIRPLPDEAVSAIVEEVWTVSGTDTRVRIRTELLVEVKN